MALKYFEVYTKALTKINKNQDEAIMALILQQFVSDLFYVVC